MTEETRRPVAVVWTHAELEGPHLLGPALRRAGFEVVERLRDPRPEDAKAAALVVMGGPMAVYEADRHPFLKAELEILRQRLEADRPTLGICLGAQLLAAAAGARVHPGDGGKVIGVLPVRLTTDGLQDPLFAGFEESFDVVHWHGDTFEPVPGGKVLASTARYPQEAFRVGRSIGLQFHPELDAATYERWVRSFPDPLAEVGRTVDDTLERDVPKLKAALHPLTLILERAAHALAQGLGEGHPERFLFTVQHAHHLAKGAVLMPGIPRRTPIVRVGETIILLRPDGTRVGGTVRGMASFGETGPFIPLLVQLDDPNAEVPTGTEVLTTAPFSVPPVG